MRTSSAAESIVDADEVDQQATRNRVRQQACWQYHVQILMAAVVVVVLSLLLKVVDRERIAFMGLEQFPLPHTCASRILWDAPCPACGLTRSFVLLFHGDLTGSLRMHPLGFWIAALVVFQIPYRVLALRSPERSLLSGRVGTVVIYGTAIALFVTWFGRQFGVL